MLLEILFAFLLNVLIIIFLIQNANKIKLIDTPNKRSSHDTPKPRGAGIAIFLSFIITIIIYKYDFFKENIYFIISLFIIFFIGLIDDIKSIKPKAKFLTIIIAIALLFFTTDLKITSLGIWFGKDLVIPPLFSLVFTIFAISGYTNALNLIDGLDGLAGGISFIIFCTFLYLGIKYNDPFIITTSSLFSIQLLAFLLFNWYPSKIFLGDSGSLLLGFTISIVAIKLIQYINTVSILFLAALPILDTIVVIVRRLQRHRSPFLADKSHIHHKILNWKTKVDFSVMLLLLIQLSFSLLGIITINESNIVNLTIYLIVLKISFYIFDERKTPRRDSITSYNSIIINKFISFKYKYHLLISTITLLLVIKSIK